MSDIDLLRKMIKESVIVPHSNNGKNTYSVKLSEHGQHKTSYAIKISGLPQDSITFKADKFPEAVNFYKGTRGENKRADYIIVADNGSKKRILFIEVKSGNNYENKKIAQQLKGAECVVAHCRAVAEKFWDEDSLLDSNDYKNRFISIVKVNIPKRPTHKLLSGKVHDKPENMLRIGNPGGSTRFAQLI